MTALKNFASKADELSEHATANTWPTLIMTGV